MNCKDVRLTCCRADVEVLVLRINIPSIEDYKTTLLRLFNNKREDKDILEIQNFYCNNDIEISIDLTAYMNDTHKTKEEVIKHLTWWLIGNMDMKAEDVKVEVSKGRVYSMYEDEFTYFDENNDFIRNYVRSEW